MEEIVGYETHGRKGFFFITIDGDLEARMNFFFDDDNIMNIRHTEVNPGNEGRGFGRRMVARAVELAREENFQIIALCPFAKSVFAKTPEFDDVLF